MVIGKVSHTVYEKCGTIHYHSTEFGFLVRDPY